MRANVYTTSFFFLFFSTIAFNLIGQGINPGNDGLITLDGQKQRQQILPTSAQQSIRFFNLTVGKTYSLVVPPDQVLGACSPDATPEDPLVEILGYDSGAHQLRFVANATSMDFKLNYYCTWDPANPPFHYISLYCENCGKKKIKELLQEMAVLEVSGGGSAASLVEDVLIGGNCFDVTNITYSGQTDQIGTFSNGLTNVGFNTGLIMATGGVGVAPGPNDADNASAGYGISTPDGDLGSLTGGAIFDMANIEFDFTPTQSPLTFEFVFASEEYCEYVNTQFNDVFGFFVTGPGITGNGNIALIPATTTPVAINTVNHLSNSGLYTNNTGASGTLCGQTASVSPVVDELQYDGFTKKMTAIANVTPCQTYHIKLKIGDVGDGIFDSAVFLKSGSFDAGGNVSVDFIVNGDPDIDEVYEGCGTVTLVFSRVGGNVNLPITVPFIRTGTATNLVDYSGIPGSVVIPAGQQSVTLTIPITNDGIIEGDETVIITLLNPCSCLQPQEILIIHDLPPLTVVPDTVVICGPGVAVVTVTPVGGVPPYTYKWSNGSMDQSATVFANISTNYTVTVTDFCGRTKTAVARVIVSPLPIAQLLAPAPQLCPGQSALININFTGVGPFTLILTLNGDPQTPITDIVDDPLSWPINQIGLYQIASVTDSLGCVGPGQGALLVTPSSLAMTAAVTNVKCFGQANGSINTTVTGGQSPYTFVWTGPTTIGNVADPTNLQAGTYVVSVTDFFGCVIEQTYVVGGPQDINPTFVNITGPNCTNPTGGGINLEVTGGTPGYNYAWNNGFNLQDPQNLNVGVYTVTITDNVGCIKTASASVVGNFTPPLAVTSAPGPITCIVPSISLDGTGSSTGAGFSYNWTASPGFIVSGNGTLNPVVNQTGNYILVVSNSANGCTASSTVNVVANNTLPTANAGPNQSLTCTVTNATLDGTGSSTGNNFTYEWIAGAGGTIIGGATSLNPVVSTAATYTLIVTNTTNGCTKTDDAVVNLNVTPPTAVIANPSLLTCVATTATLNGSGSTPNGNLSYSWSTSNGLIISGSTSANAVVGEPGQYTLVVSNNSNGCTDSKTVTVSQDNSVPTALASVNGQLTCTVNQLSLNGTGSSAGSNINIQWSATPGGVFVSGQNTLTPIVSAPGTYTLLVTNTTNNCTASASILVPQDNQPPAANPGPPGTLTCTTTSLTLGDPGAVIAPNLVYAWTGTGIQSGASTPTPTVVLPGTFSLQVTNTQNGCVSTSSVQIGQNITNPTAVVAPGGQLTCTSPAILLSGTGSSTGPTFAYDWTSASGGGIGTGGSTLSPTVTAAGVYTLLVTNNANGCTATASTNVSSNANLPTAIAVPSGIITCNVPSITLNGAGSTTGPTMSYQWGTIGGQISGGQGSLQATVTAPGQYTLIVTNTANNCTASFNLTVNADVTPPVADAGQTETLLCIQPTLALDGSGSSTGANFSYAWTGPAPGSILGSNTVLNPTINQAGTYQLLVTNTSNGCTSTNTVLINVDPNAPVAAIATPSTLTCITQQTPLNTTGSSTGANFSYIWTGSGLQTAPTQLNATVNQPGNYTLVVTNSINGCTSSASILVNQNIAAPPIDAGPDDVLNCNNPQLQLGGPGNPSGPGFTFQWSGTGILAGVNSSNAIVNQGGVFSLLVTNTQNGCTSTETVNISTDFTPPVANAGAGFQLTCIQNTYTMGASASTGPNFTYNWTTNTGSFTTPFNILNPTINGSGIYTLLVSNTTNGCTSTSTVQITQAADVPVAVTTVPAVLTCSTQTVPLSGVGSSTGTEFSYLWTAASGGNIVSGPSTLAPVVNQPGIYTLAVTNTTNNCVSYSETTVQQDINPPAINGGPAPTLTCAQPNASLNGSVNTNGTFNYLWTTQSGGNILSGNTTLSPVVNAGGIYQLLVTSQQNGCTSSATVQALVDQTPPQALIQNPQTLTCVTTEVLLDASASTVGNMTYTWSNTSGNTISINQNDPTQATVSLPGVYALLVTNNGNGCTQSTNVTVPQNIQNPIANAGANDLLTCAVTSAELNGAGSSTGTPGTYFYQWSTSNGQILVGANSLTPTVIAGGIYNLVVVNNGNGCTATDNVLVDVDTQVPNAVIASPDVITCTEPLVVLNGNASQGGPNISYAWTTPDGNIVNGLNANQATIDLAGTYTLNVLNNTNGCSNSVTVNVSDNIVLPIADAGNPSTLTCTYVNVSLQGSGSTGSIYSYQWTSTNGQILSGATTLSPVVNEPGLYTLVVTNVTTGCTNTDDVDVFIETNIPTGFEIVLDKPGCKDNDGVISIPEVFGGYGPYLYSIDGGNTFVPEFDFNNIQPGNYELVIQDINGCEVTEDLNVPKAPDPGVSIDPSSFSIQLGDSLSLQAFLPAGYPLSLVDTVIWKPLDGLYFKSNSIQDLLRPGGKPFKLTEYTVTVISVDGCQASDKVLIRVDNEPHIFIPNAFSPWDGNDFNDVVYIQADGDQVVKVQKFQIFDRWGEMVFQDFNFQPNDPGHGWNGQLNNKYLTPGVFVYYAEVLLIDGRIILFKGDVTLVR